MAVSFTSTAVCRYNPFNARTTKLAFSANAHLKSNQNASSDASPPISPPKGLSRMLSYHWDTPFPISSQLRQADQFFRTHNPELLYSSEKFRTVKESEVPEVAFLGRSNVGKSSLLNALMGRKMCHTSKEPGRTRTMNFFAVGGPDGSGNPGRLVLLDMPGYGKGSQNHWGSEILKYLARRKQLRRAFLLVDPLHGLKPLDKELLRLLRTYAVSHQIILSKVDRVLFPGSKNPSELTLQNNSPKLQQVYQTLQTEVQPGKRDGPEGLGEIISCSAEKSLEKGKRVGMDQVRWAVLAATGLGDKQKLVLDATGLRNRKQKLSLSDVTDEDEFDIEQPLPDDTKLRLPTREVAPNFRSLRP